MRWMLWLALASGFAGGCGSSAPTDAKVCKQMSSLCRAQGMSACLDADDWREMRKELGDAPIDRFRTCAVKASQCTALTACVLELGADAVRKLDDRQLDKLGLRDPDAAPEPAPDAAPTPPPTAAPDAAIDPAPDATIDPAPDATTDPAPDAATDPRAAGDDRPGVRFDVVKVRTAATAFGHEVSVSIELTVTGAMPHVPPEVTVEAACGGATDAGHAFFTSLSNARVGDRRSDTAKLFTTGELTAAPTSCDITLGLSAGATGPAHYCFRGGATTVGDCPP